jgi:quercetin dioxygenase-like cupin family protein
MGPQLELVHSDARGDIYSITLPNHQEVMLLSSKAGTLRGGHSHDCDEVVMLISGKMRYHKLIGQVDVTSILEPGDLSHNPAGEVHMGEFVEDSWVLEVKQARIGEWTQENYPPYRERVDASN